MTIIRSARDDDAPQIRELLDQLGYPADLTHQTGRIGRITALVVDAASRRKGIGALLLAAADEFFRRVGCVRAEVTSGEHRTRAHAFYESRGYLPDERRFLKRYDP